MAFSKKGTNATFNLLSNLSLKVLEVSFEYPTAVALELISLKLLLPSIVISNERDPVGFLSSLINISTSAKSWSLTYSKKEVNPENSITNKAPKIISPPDYIYKKGQK